MGDEPVTLYTQDGCADSERVRACFLRSSVPFVERNVSHDRDALADLAATGLFATPLVQAGDRVLLAGRLAALADALGFRCRCPSLA